MTVRGQVISQTGEPLQGASITLVNNKGEYLNEGVKADGSGKFAITSSFLSGNYLLVSYAGMTSLMIDPDDFTGTTYKQIEMFPRLLDEVVVTPGSNIKAANLWWLLAIVGVSMLASKKGKKRIARKARNRSNKKR